MDVSDDRLRAVAEHVRGWLFGRAAKAKAKTRTAKRSPALRLFTA